MPELHKQAVKERIFKMRIDFHSHILPKMDDGASDVSESIKMLKMLAKAKVDHVVLTPHFYRQNENIQKFLDRRSHSYERLCEAIEGISGLPELSLGAEVYFYPSLSSDPDFGKLCMENTDYILLELPFERFHDNFHGEFMNFMNRCDHRIILAHVERYLSFGNKPEDIRRIYKTGRNIICQMNCSSIAEAGIFERGRLLKMISDGMISVLGTDAHNLSHRPPLFKKAEEIIVRKCGQSEFERICRIGEDIL